MRFFVAGTVVGPTLPATSIMLTHRPFFYKIQYSQLRFGVLDRGIPQQGPSPVAVERTEGYYPVTRGLI